MGDHLWKRFVVLAPAAVVGCNSVLNNPPGQLAETDGGAADVAEGAPEGGAPEVSAPAPADAEVPPVVDATVPHVDAAPPPVVDAGAAPTCPFGEKQCDGACVSTVNPAYGCGLAACAACSVAHASPGCSAAGCSVAACDPGYADCDGEPANGCETDLSQVAHCGTCNATCPASAPDCAPTGDGFACSTGCGPGDPTLCGGQCVSLTTSLDDCGACGRACPVVTNGQASCVNGNCGFVCHADFHPCGDVCASDVSASTCGTSCAPCPAEANAIATCDGAKCGMACQPGFASCDGVAANGCEVNLLTDPANCGNCKSSCGGLVCSAGSCAAPPDAGSDAGQPPPDAGGDSGSSLDAAEGG
jgi:hypothetical protein